MKKKETTKQFLITAIVAVFMLASLPWFIENVVTDKFTKPLFNSLGGTTQRDNVIKNWQKHVSNSQRCKSYKERFKVAGTMHESSATGAFVMDMTKVKESAKKANCLFKP